METEAKFVVPGDETFSRLKAVEKFGPYERRETRVKTIHDRYVDTEDHRFYRQGFFVRLRAGKNGDLLLTMKRLGGDLMGAVHSRDEFETKVQDLNPTGWPESEARTRVQEIGGDMDLRDLVALDQTRTVSKLFLGDHAVAELSLDEVTIQTPQEPVRSYELEAEMLSDGTESDLDALVRIFAEEYGLTPQPLSKFERAMLLSMEEHEPPMLESDGATQNGGGDAGNSGSSTISLADTVALTAGLHDAEPAAAAEPPVPEASDEKPAIGITATDTMDDAGRKIIGTYFRAMEENEEGTIAGEDLEFLHDMRVATRRMRAALRVLEPYMHEDHMRAVRGGLRSTARALGAVRDLDVLIENAQAFKDSLPEEQQPDMTSLLDDWDSKRRKARKAMMRLLRSKDYSRFKRRMDSFLEEESTPLDETAGAQPHQVRHVAGSAILIKYEAVRAFETLMEAPSVEQLHALRIAGKYLRYTLECFREALSPQSGNLIKDVTKMQDQLGILHDADVAAILIRDHIASQAGKAKRRNEEYEVPAGLAAYLNDRETTVRRCHEEFFPTWAKLMSHAWRARLAAVITQI